MGCDGMIREIREQLLFVDEILSLPLSDWQFQQFNLYHTFLLDYN